MSKRKDLIMTAVATATVFIATTSAGYVLYHSRTRPKIVEPNFTKNQNSTNKATPPGGSATGSSPDTIWHPKPQTSWQWQLSTPVDLSVNAEMYDIDLFTNNASVVNALHAKGRKVICYISAGSLEDWRSDANQFPESVVGKEYKGWPGEKWLDIRRLDILAPIMSKRLDQCRDKGFDGVEPDNINGYSQDTGFALTAADQLKYNRWLATEAHKRNLSIGLKQDPDQAAVLVNDFDWALDEECFENGECDKMTPFIQAGKAVFNAEYALETSQFCTKANILNFNSIRKHKELDLYRESCR